MNNPISRRAAMQTTAVTTAGLALAGPASLARAAHHGKHKVTIGLSQYSLRFLFQKGEVDVMDYPAFAIDKLGIKHLDVWEGGFAKDKQADLKTYEQMRQRGEKAGAEIFLLMTGAVQAGGRTPAEQKANAEAHYPVIERARTLGAEYLRIFLKAPNTDRATAIRASAETLKPLADRAAERGVTLAIEPGASDHAKQGAFLADLMKAMPHAACKLMPDFGKLTNNVYSGTQAMMPHAAVISAKSHNFDANGDETEFDYYRLMKIILGAGFRDIVAIEYEGKVTPPVEGVLATKRLIEKAVAAV
ncbi:MAG: sugar phosphate isomerase/epimerase family protein [Planctomycetota bacterium]|jgi:hypothetical protein